MPIRRTRLRGLFKEKGIFCVVQKADSKLLKPPVLFFVILLSILGAKKKTLVFPSFSCLKIQFELAYQ